MTNDVGTAHTALFGSELQKLLAAYPAGSTITEATALDVLTLAGVPTVRRILCSDEEEIAARAPYLRYPIVLKVASPHVVHKSDVGGVIPNIATPAAITTAVADMRESLRNARPDLHDYQFLLEEMADGTELLAGLKRTEFGPVIVFGLGGVAVEALHDVVYRLAPLSLSDAVSMVASIRSQSLLTGFRGRPPINRERVARILVRLSELGDAFSRISEVDINPLVANGQGELIAVDSRIVIGDERGVADVGSSSRESDASPALLFAPRSVAVVGVKTGGFNRGRVWLRSVRAAGYGGRLAAVSRQGPIEDFQTFGSLDDVPKPLDLVMVEVGRNSVGSVVQDAVRNGAHWISIRASGYESDANPAASLDELRALVSSSAAHIVGPAALGPYCPESGLVADGVSKRPGHLGILSQSGALATMLAKVAEEKSMGISKALSYGQEGDATVDTFLEYLGDDAATAMIAIYVEGLKQPKRFASVLRRVAALKPVLILHGGRTTAGSRAAASHTGALTGSGEQWRALVDSTGAIAVDSLDDLIDHIVAFYSMATGWQVSPAIVTSSGAAAVMFSDACGDAGLSVHEPARDTAIRLSKILPAGTSARNPIDVANAYFDADTMREVFAAISEDPAFSLILFHMAMETVANVVDKAPWVIDPFVAAVKHGAAAASTAGKRFVVLLPHTVLDDRRSSLERDLLSVGIPVFADIRRACGSISAVARWGRSPRES